MKIGMAFLSLLIVVGCSSTKVTDNLEEEYKNSTPEKGEKVGLKDDKIVLQKRISLEEQLHSLGDEVEELQRITYGRSLKEPGGVWEELSRCRKKMADPRLGGNGLSEPMEKWEDLSSKDADFEHTVDKKSKKVIAVTEEALNDRIGRLKQAKSMLSDKYAKLKDKSEICEEKYKTSLVEHGLNPEDTKSEGEWVDGPQGYKVWKMKRSSTTDPEELMKRKKKRETKSVEDEG